MSLTLSDYQHEIALFELYKPQDADPPSGSKTWLSELLLNRLATAAVRFDGIDTSTAAGKRRLLRATLNRNRQNRRALGQGGTDSAASRMG